MLRGGSFFLLNMQGFSSCLSSLRRCREPTCYSEYHRRAQCVVEWQRERKRAILQEERGGKEKLEESAKQEPNKQHRTCTNGESGMVHELGGGLVPRASSVFQKYHTNIEYCETVTLCDFCDLELEKSGATIMDEWLTIVHT
jgi:hypothetical protein